MIIALHSSMKTVLYDVRFGYFIPFSAALSIPLPSEWPKAVIKLNGARADSRFEIDVTAEVGLTNTTSEQSGG